MKRNRLNLKKTNQIIRWGINLNLIFWPLWILIILITDGFVLNFGLFEIKARHITNPLIFFALSLAVKIWINGTWLKTFLKKEDLPLKQEVSRNPWPITTFILLAYLGLSLFFTYPLILNFTKAVPGDGGDNPMFLWNLWWVKYALVDLKTNPFFTNYIFYPIGIGLATHTLVFLNGLISIPLQLLFGLTIANNIVLLLCFVLSAYGAYLLINYLVKDNLSAFLGGIIFAFCPYKFAHLLGHYNLMTTQWIPFYILYLLKMKNEKENKYKHALLAALFLLFTALSDFYYLVFLIIFTLIFLTYFFFYDRKAIIKTDFIKALVTLIIVFAITFSPMAWLLMADIREGSLPLNPGGAREYVADLIGFFIPSVLHPFFGSLVRPITRKFVGNACEWTVFIGYTVILLVLITLIKFRRNPEPKFWLSNAFIFFLLSFGLYPHVMGKEIKFPFPFFIINFLPLVNNVRAPSRLSIMLMLSLAVLASFALRFIFEKIKKSWLRKAFFIFFIMVISFEYLAIPFPLFKTKYPQVYEKVKQEKEAGVILEIPLTWQDGFRMVGGTEGQAKYIYYQILHQRPIFGGYVARIPDSKIEYFRRSPIIKTIIKLEEMAPYPEIIDFQKEKNLVRNFIDHYKVKYLIIHKPYLNGHVHQYLSEIIPGEIFHLDKNQIGYKVNHESDPSPINLEDLNLKFINLNDFKTVIEEGTSCYAKNILRFRKSDLLHVSGLSSSQISKVDLSFDGNDLYEIVFKRANEEIRKFWVGPKNLPERQMARYILEINPPLEAIDLINIRGVYGDKYYFLGHILIN
ncbi:MAG: hypothetical protein N3B16_09710 [Candidatus Aminicenantes bacterium]|nr:hypothetical protein [Candidatus Aminicenantes bacterium]